MKTRLASKTVVKETLINLVNFGYTVEKIENTPFKSSWVVYDSFDKVVFRALPHSSGKNYLIQYDTGVMI